MPPSPPDTPTSRGSQAKHQVPNVPFTPWEKSIATPGCSPGVVPGGGGLGDPGPQGRSPRGWPQQRAAWINVPRASMKPLLNPRDQGIRSPLPMFILRKKRSSRRHPSPGTKSLGGTLGGAGGPPLLTPHAPVLATARYMGPCTPTATRYVPSPAPSLPSRAPQNLLAFGGGGRAGWEAYSKLMGCPGSNPVSQGP